MTSYLSKKIAFFHAFGVLLVLPIHTIFPCTDSFGTVRHLLVLLCRSFQPIYFGLAGYLFFIGVLGGNCKDKILKRIKTLLVPYLIWNVWVAILMIALYYWGIDAPIVSNFEEHLGSYSLLSVLKYIFWTPVAGHLWFIRDLMLVSILSLPLYYVLRNNKWYTLIILCLIALLTYQVQFASLFSFAVGGYLSINKVDIQKIKNGIVIVAGILLMALFVIFACMKRECNAIPVMSWGTAILLWVLYDKIIPNDSSFDITPWRSYFFFIYLFHNPFLNIICAYASKMLPNTFLSNSLVFILSQLTIVFISLQLGKFMNVHTPRLYAIITGNRKR